MDIPKVSGYNTKLGQREFYKIDQLSGERIKVAEDDAPDIVVDDYVMHDNSPSHRVTIRLAGYLQEEKKTSSGDV